MAVNESEPIASRDGATFEAHPEASGVWVIAVAGEVDLASEHAMRDCIEQALGNNPVELVFDLAGVEFIDSSGVAQMLVAAKRVSAVSVRNPSRIAQRVIEVSGLAGMLKSKS